MAIRGAWLLGASGHRRRCVVGARSSVGALLMDAHFPVRRGVAELKGRQVECEVLDRLIEAVRQGESRALVLRVEPGVGKTALLDYLAEHASGCVVARAAGVQSEMELAFAGLQQFMRADARPSATAAASAARCAGGGVGHRFRCPVSPSTGVRRRSPPPARSATARTEATSATR
jgi:hypothetical protein